MSKDISVFSHAKSSDIRLKIFSDIMIKGALFLKYVDELTQQFPIYCFKNLHENNKREDISVCNVLTFVNLVCEVPQSLSKE